MEIECGPGLHDGSRRAGSNGDSVGLGVVAGQVRLDLKLFAAVDDRTARIISKLY